VLGCPRLHAPPSPFSEPNNSVQPIPLHFTPISFRQLVRLMPQAVVCRSASVSAQCGDGAILCLDAGLAEMGRPLLPIIRKRGSGGFLLVVLELLTQKPAVHMVLIHVGDDTILHSREVPNTPASAKFPVRRAVSDFRRHLSQGKT
jgi:hypothetical protein